MLQQIIQRMTPRGVFNRTLFVFAYCQNIYESSFSKCLFGPFSASFPSNQTAPYLVLLIKSKKGGAKHLKALGQLHEHVEDQPYRCLQEKEREVKIHTQIQNRHRNNS